MVAGRQLSIRLSSRGKAASRAKGAGETKLPSIDFSGIKDLEAIEADTYDAVLDEFELKQGPKGDYYSLKFKITDGEFEGRSQWRNISITPNSLWAFKRACIALGADPGQFDGSLDTDEVLESVLGNPCRIKVSVREYEGRNTNQVDAVLAPGF